MAAVCLTASVVPASRAGATAESDGEVTDETAEAASGVEVVRLWGKDRYATSLVVAGEFVRAIGGPVDRVVLASGRSDSSAAVAAALAGGIDAPLLLVPPDGLGSDALTLLADARVQEALVVDWSRELAEMALASTRRAGIRVARVAGESPAALSVTAGEIVGVKNPPASAQGTGEGPAEGRPDTVEGLALPTRQVRAVVLAGSREPAAAAVLAARARLPLLLTSEGSLPADITEFLGLHDVTHAVVVGPTATTTSDTLRQVEASGIEATVLGGHGLVGRQPQSPASALMT
ncbi:MAG: cell wall-binding repeat-containing protein [Acidimicrobiaceae bacterium]|nr:cell wall-binding repeat-containing protein [Acidimicrobiaceae bacterium]